MADKNFGVKKLNLIGASGTPSIDSPNNLNINAINVAISTDLTIGGEINSNIKVGSAYSVGIGTTNPTSKLHVIGDGYFSGSINAESFTGIASTAVTAYNLLDAANILSGTISTERLTGEYDIDISGKSKDVVGGIASLTSLNVSGISTLGNILISAGIVTAVNGVATYYGDGSKLENLNLAGAGISIYNNNNLLGVASAINFIEYIDVEFGGTISTISVNKDAINYFKLSDVGIHTLSNVGIGTTNATNTLTVVGTVTATNYYGDGSTLTNVVSIANSSTVQITTTDIEINWLDTYGDGWNNGLVDVYVDDVLVIDDYTIPDVGDNTTTGISTLTNVSVGSTIKIERVALGDYPEEMEISSVVIPGSTESLLSNYNFTSVGIETVFITIPSEYAISPTSDGQDGDARFNHYINKLEYHNGTSWIKSGDVIVKNNTNIVSGDLTSAGETGSNNIFLGVGAGSSNSTGNYNNFFGQCAGYYNTTACHNNFLGSDAGRSNTTGYDNNFLGRKAGFANTTGNNNNFFGQCAGYYNTTGDCNNFFGFCAGYSNTTAYNNNFFGKCAGRCNTTGVNNNFFGVNSGDRNTTGSYNNFIGFIAGQFNTTGCYNNFLGYLAGYANTNGCNNNFLGCCAGASNTTANDNNFLGAGAGYASTTGGCNNFLGFNAGFCNTTGSYNNFFGRQTGFCNTSGCNNNFIGKLAGCKNTTGRNNNFIGESAGVYNTTGCFNNFFGFAAGARNTTSNNNNFFGFRAGFYSNGGTGNNFIGECTGHQNTTGNYNNFLGTCAGRCNTIGSCNNFLGFYAGPFNTIGCNNNFLGFSAGRCNINGCNNNFLGCYAGRCNTSGCFNNYFGSNAARLSTTACNNNFFGQCAGYSNTTGSCNNFIGFCAARSNTTGFHNSFFGSFSGRFNTTGNYNIFLGSYTGSSTTASNKIILGRGCNNVDVFDAPNTTKDTQFAVGVKTDANPSKYWLVGDENFNIGIGTTNPKVRLQIDGVLGFGTFTVSGNNTTNIRIGDETTGAKLTTGFDNIFMGVGAGNSITTGRYNIFIGSRSGTATTTGDSNIFIGDVTGLYNIGKLNTFTGSAAGVYNTTGSYNNFFGSGAGFYNSTGSYNTFLGFSGGYWNTTGTRNIFVGYYVGTSDSTTASNKILFGSSYDYTYRFDAPDPTKDTQFAVGVRTDANPSKYWLVGDENFNIGIGTTNPQYKLDVGGSIKISDRIYDSNDSSGGNNQVLTSGGPSGVWTWKDLGAVGNANISILDQGSVLGSFSVIDYVGSNISATGTGSTATITFTDSPTFTNLNVTGVSTFQSDVYLGDDDKLYFGGGNDLEIYHNSSVSTNYIDSNANIWIRSRVSESDIYISSFDDLFLRVNNGSNAIVATGGGSVDLYHSNSKKFETTGAGVSISNGGTNTATITGPANLIIDPATVNDNTGVVRIKGDLYVDGTTTQINSTTIELADFIVGIATTATTDLLADGAGIQIGPDNTLLYDYNGGTDSSLKSSENLNVAANKGYQVDGTLVLNSTTLGSTVVNSSLTNVGILTGLSVNGDVYIQQNNTLYFDSSSDASLYYNQTSESLQLSLGSNANDFRISDGGNERFRFVKSTGNLGVGLTNPTEKIDVNGNVKAIDFNTTSDRNLKDNIQIIENPIEKLTQINGVSFEWKKDQKQSIGVIAQEIEKVFPELVSGDDVKTVNYNGLIGVLIECVKKQQEEIEDLKQRVYKY